VPQKPEPRFLAITGHDLRGAVGVLDGAMKELARELPKDSAEAAKLSLMMARSTQRLLLLADRLTVLAKLMDGTKLDSSDAVDLTALVKEAAHRAFSAHARRGLQLSVEGAPLRWSGHAPSIACAVSELTALVCSFSQTNLVVRISAEAAAVRVSFESDNAGESVQRALRDRTGTTQTNAAIAFAETVAARHQGELELSADNGSNAALHLVLPR
jgi:signal transduction histidine kinase